LILLLGKQASICPDKSVGVEIEICAGYMKSKEAKILQTLMTDKKAGPSLNPAFLFRILLDQVIP